MKWYKETFSYIIIIANLIPLVGYTLAGWEMIDIFLFYSVELCWYEFTMLNKIVLYSKIASYSFWEAFRTAVFYWFIHLLLFGLALHFLLATSVIALTNKATYTLLWMFDWVKGSYIFVIAIGLEYLISLINYYRKREYNKVSEEDQLKEIALFYFFLLIPIGVSSGLIIGLELNLFYYQMIAMISIILLKTITQINFRFKKIQKLQV